MNVLLLIMILLLFLMFGDVNLAEWYDNYYWIIYAKRDDGVNSLRIVICDREFTVYNGSLNRLFISGNINRYSSVTSERTSQTINWFNSQINRAEPTLTNATDPSIRRQ